VIGPEYALAVDGELFLCRLAEALIGIPRQVTTVVQRRSRTGRYG
jgi:hypothetical protein